MSSCWSLGDRRMTRINSNESSTGKKGNLAKTPRTQRRKSLCVLCVLARFNLDLCVLLSFIWLRQEVGLGASVFIYGGYLSCMRTIDWLRNTRVWHALRYDIDNRQTEQRIHDGQINVVDIGERPVANKSFQSFGYRKSQSQHKSKLAVWKVWLATRKQ